MIKKKDNTCILFNNRVLFIFLFILFSVVFAARIRRCKITHSQIYSDLQGTYEMELDSSYVNRFYDVIPVGFIVHIHKDNIRLPTFSSEKSDTVTRYTYQDLLRIDEEKNGNWKIISSNPDSIFIDARMHMLHGKYQVKFKTYKTGSLGYTTADYLYLDNDSTHLCLKKVK